MHEVVLLILERLPSPWGSLGLAAVFAVQTGFADAPSPGEVGHRIRRLPIRTEGAPGFTLLPVDRTAVAFTNQLSDATAAENQIRLNGSGVALGDVDGDGWCDVYLCGLDNGNALYRNLGDWRFTNVTSRAGVACADQDSSGAALADLDGDGDLDLLVNGIGVGTRLFLNHGRGDFTEQLESGLARRGGATSSALADIDGDGDLDLYVANYRTTTIRSTGLPVLNMNGRRVIRPEDRDHLEYTPEGRVLEHGEPDYLYLNDGRGQFTECSWTGGRFLDEDGLPLQAPPRDWGLSVMFRDLNGDHHPDLYVCNDFHSSDKIWINDGQGGFRLLSRLAVRHTPTFSMCVDFADVNRDGWEDIYVSDMLGRTHARRMMQYAGMDPQVLDLGEIDDRPQYDHSTLHLNRGDGTYAEIAFYSRLEACDWTWSASFLDVDLDGFEDLLCACGHQFDTQDLDAAARIWSMGPWPREKIPRKLLLFPRMRQPKLAFRNQGDLTFEEVGAAWGFDQEGVAHGLALGDLDRDGDQDVVVNNLNLAAGLYRNNSSAPLVSVRLEGQAPNTEGVGARIRLLHGAVALQSQERISAGRYLSSDDGLRVFAAGTSPGPMRLEIDWRSGKRSTVEEVRAGQEIVVAEAAAEVVQQPDPVSPVPLFEDWSDRLQHRHQELPFNDYEAQPLLPWSRSLMGPGVAWFDLNGDGTEELLVGGGRGGRLGVFRWSQRQDGRFEQLRGGVLSQTFAADQSGLTGWIDGLGGRWLLAGQTVWEGNDKGGVVGYDLVRNKRRQWIDDQPWDTGPMAVGDLDGDGDLDLVVGAGARPGRYPEAGSTVCYRNEHGRLVKDARNTAVLEDSGLVRAALLSDWDSDGDSDLILACAWGPVRVYRNERGALSDATEALGFAARTGWWNGVATGDFDADGRLDIVASNWGLNTKYRASVNSPRRLYFGDLDGNGTLDVIETYVDPITGREVPERDFTAVTAALPQVLERFQTHRGFASATAQEIFGTALETAKVLSVNTLASMVFFNRGDHFEPRELPLEAQLAPAWAVVVADYNGDGCDDCFLSQNFFGYQSQTTRADAGRGLLLLGDGTGRMQAIPGPESGLLIYGDQRGAAAGDFDADGRMDLVVSQNSAATVLCRNVGSQPTLRVRLKGPPSNPSAIGAQLRLRFGSRLGPLREIQAGSGYWSQSSAVALMGKPTQPSAVQVRWPGGRVTESPIDPTAKELRIDQAGAMTVMR
jgi:hypothetical protein